MRHWSNLCRRIIHLDRFPFGAGDGNAGDFKMFQLHLQISTLILGILWDFLEAPDAMPRKWESLGQQGLLILELDNMMI